MALLNKQRSAQMGFSTDIRKRRRQHRKAARQLLTGGGIFNGLSARGSTFHAVAMWHLEQARAL